MISKQNFMYYINKLQQLREAEDSINSAGNNLIEFNISFGEHEQLIVDILEKVFDDQSCWINFFIYELNFGKDWNEGIVIMDDEDVRMSNAGELWDVLVGEMCRINGEVLISEYND